MLPDLQRTSVALASGPRPAERAIVRMAGPQTRQLLAQLCTNLPAEFLDSSKVTWCDCQCALPAVQKHLPVTLIYWPNERSYTGCPAAELHVLGCLPLADAVLARCCELGAKMAERGEFTLRAFLAGKLDLAQAEAVLGVIEADSAVNLQAALGQLGGNLAPAVAPLRASVLSILAELEAGLDFVEEDIQFISMAQIEQELHEIIAQLDQFALRLDTRSNLDRVPSVVLTGVPNSGKSSLFNALCQQPLAIVADVPGTTRDYLQQRLGSGDIAFDLIDTAGWEQLTEYSPRAMAQGQLQRCLAEAQLIVLCIDATQLSTQPGYWHELREQYALTPWLVVATKGDLIEPAARPDVSYLLDELKQQLGASQVIITSCPPNGAQVQESVDQLRTAMAQTLKEAEQRHKQPESSGPLAVVHETAVRCRAALSAARASLQAALDTARAHGAEELIAAELRLALDDLATIIGEVHSEDVLGEIFSRFCIGK